MTSRNRPNIPCLCARNGRAPQAWRPAQRAGATECAADRCRSIRDWPLSAGSTVFVFTCARTSSRWAERKHGGVVNAGSKCWSGEPRGLALSSSTCASTARGGFPSRCRIFAVSADAGSAPYQIRTRASTRRSFNCGFPPTTRPWSTVPAHPRRLGACRTTERGVIPGEVANQTWRGCQDTRRRAASSAEGLHYAERLPIGKPDVIQSFPAHIKVQLVSPRRSSGR